MKSIAVKFVAALSLFALLGGVALTSTACDGDAGAGEGEGE
jgi:hypothetical protein